MAISESRDDGNDNLRQIDLLRPSQHGEDGSSDTISERAGDPPSPKKSLARRKLGAVKEAASKVVEKVHPHPFADKDHPALNHIRHNPAFNSSSVEKEYLKHHDAGTSFADRSRSTAEDAMGLASHPTRTIKQKLKQTAASKFISMHYPYASKPDEYRFLNSHADASKSLRRTSEDDNPQNQGDLLENRRDSLRAAWTTSHLRRVRVVPWKVEPFPKMKDFYEGDPEQQPAKLQWHRWIGHILLYLTQNVYPPYVDQFDELPFDLVTTRTHVERLVLNSGHWQAWFMDLRSVYRWEDPKRTTRWLVIYFSLWYFQLIPTFVWAYVLYHVLTNRFKGHSINHLRAAADRVLDRESTAFQIGELIDRHGQDELLDQLVQNLGPYAQLQLGDMANMLEVLYSFYTWKSPLHTAYTLCFCAVCLLICILTSTQFCMKIVFFVAGGSFFFCWPISSRYPRYRLLVSPLKWVFWGIPTDAELSFKYLQQQAQLNREEIIKNKVEAVHQSELDSPPLRRYAGKLSMDSPSILLDRVDNQTEINSCSEDDDWQSAMSAQSLLGQENLVSFRAYCEGISGRLSVSSTGVVFRRNYPRKQMWDLPFQELEQIWKSGLGGRRKLTIGGLFDSGILVLKDTSGQTRVLDPIKHRDEAFNCLIGFSGLQWQVIPSEPGKGRKTAEQKKKKLSPF